MHIKYMTDVFLLLDKPDEHLVRHKPLVVILNILNSVQ